MENTAKKKEWSTVKLFGWNYHTHPCLQFGDYDNSCEAERGNVLFAIKDSANIWSGQVEYNPKLDKVLIHGVDITNPNAMRRAFAEYGIQYSSLPYDEATTTDIEADWEAIQIRGDPPHAILYTYTTSTVLFVRNDVYEGSEYREALETDDILSDDSNEEVELILRDSAWTHTVRGDLEQALIHIWKTDHELHADMCGVIVRHTGRGEGEIIVRDKLLKDAFWQHLHERNDFGHFENTAWEGFAPDVVARAILPVLIKDTPRKTPTHVN
jgi:hypothetical protein